MIKRPRLRPKTTLVLYALENDPGGATAAEIGKRCGVSTRSAATRAAWLERAGLVAYSNDGALWRLTDDARGRLFTGKGPPA